MADPKPQSFELRDKELPENGSPRRASLAGWSQSTSRYDPGDATKEQHDWKAAKHKDDDAGWKELLKAREEASWRSFSWISTRALLDSANDRIAKGINDLVGPRRQRWVAAQRARGMDELTCERKAWTSFLILGDPGEADGSQYAVVDPMLSVHRADGGTHFMLVLSDVIYPAGDVNHYANGLYIPYRGYDKPILAIPGNHDWYDGLNGFMFHFCQAEALPPTQYRRSSFTAPERLALFLWRQASRPSRTMIRRHRSLRAEAPTNKKTPEQPGPYFAVDLDGVRLVMIDTGIAGTIDAEQAEWLIKVSEDEPGERMPKVLMTGKPIWVDGKYHPTRIEWERGHAHERYGTVDDIVIADGNHYVAAIGGDTHNYQRYTITVGDDDESRRRIEYIVTGGAGAYTSATHRIGKINHRDRGPHDESLPARMKRLFRKPKEVNPPDRVGAVTEEQFRCYPTRGDSLAYYARFFGRRLFWTMSALTAITVVALYFLAKWDKPGDELIDQSVFEVFRAAAFCLPVATFITLALVVVARLLAPRGYKTVATLLVVPAGLAALAAWAHSEEPAVWFWVWRTTLVTLGVVAIPLGLVLIAYYGLGSNLPGSAGRMPRQFALIALAVAEVVVIGTFEDWSLVPDDPAVLAIAAAGVIAVLLVVVGRAMDMVIRRFPDIPPWLSALVAFAMFLGYVIPAVVYAWDGVWAVRVAVTAAAAVIALLTVLLLAAVTLNGGLLALAVTFWNGRIDPDAAVKYVRDKYGTKDTHDDRLTGKVGLRAWAVGVFLLPPVSRFWKAVRWLPGIAHPNKFISEAGNADVPPMFKHFLRVDLKDGKLVIKCYGVTGWSAHATTVPVEDRVEIPLAPETTAAESPAEEEPVPEEVVQA